MATSVAKLAVILTADTKPFQKGIGKSQTAMQQFGRVVKGFGVGVAVSLAASATAVAAVFASMVKNAFSAIDTTKKFAGRLGIATDKLMELHHAAELSGVETNAMSVALQRMTRRVAQAANGAGEAKDAIADMGLNAKELSKLSADKQFLEIAKGLRAINKQGDKVTTTFKIFDTEGVGLINTIEGLEDAMADARRLGFLVTDRDARKIEQANDAITRMKVSIQGLANNFAVKLAPTVERVANLMSRFISERAGSWVAWFNGQTDILIRRLSIVRDVLRSINAAFTGGLERLQLDLTIEKLERENAIIRQAIDALKPNSKASQQPSVIPTTTTGTSSTLESRFLNRLPGTDVNRQSLEEQRKQTALQEINNRLLEVVSRRISELNIDTTGLGI